MGSKALGQFLLTGRIEPPKVEAPKAVRPGTGAAESFKPHQYPLCSYEASGNRTCTVCGVTERKDLIRPDLQGLRSDWASIGKNPDDPMNGGMKYHYIDALGRSMSSLIELSCPTFIGDTNGTLAETKERVRNTTNRVTGVEANVTQVEGRVTSVEDGLESMEQRMARVELENEALKHQVASQKIDLTAFITWLAQRVRDINTQEQLPERQVVLLPPQLAGLLPAHVTQEALPYPKLPIEEKVAVETVPEEDEKD